MQITCAFFHALKIFHYLSYHTQTLAEGEKSLFFYVGFTNSAISIYLLVATFIILWYKQSDILKIINYDGNYGDEKALRPFTTYLQNVTTNF